MKKILAILCVWFVPVLLVAQNYAPFHAHYIGNQTHNINQTFISSDTISLTNYGTIYSLSINSTILQPNEGSFVRIVLEDINGHDYLVAESDWMRNDTTTVNLSGYCEETAKLSGIIPSLLKCYVSDATMTLHFVQTSASPVLSAPSNISNDSIRRLQVQNIVDRINSYNQQHNKLWKAGTVPRALTSFDERINHTSQEDSYMANMVYYEGGIYEIGERTDTLDNTIDSLYVDSFDYRNLHGRNWTTIAKNQGNSKWCSIYAAVAGVEAMTNLYFNQNLNLDLSEQDVANSLGMTSRYNSTWPQNALSKIEQVGVIDEESFPTTFNSLPAPRPNATEKIFTIDKTIRNHDILTFDSVKHILINEGPIVSGIHNSSHFHAMLMVGFNIVQPNKIYYRGDDGWCTPPLSENDYRIGKTYWIFKDSYYGNPDKEYEENGFMPVYFNNIAQHYLDTLCTISPYIIREGFSDSDIVVEDLDGDGYFNWGIGPKPAHCPAWVPDEPDGDDSDYLKGPMNEYGYCAELDSLRKRYIYIDHH